MSYYGSPPPPPPGYGPPPPGYGPYQPPIGPPPDNYLVWAILTTILCCLPFGVVSIVYAAQVNSKWAMGDMAGAYAASRNARLWATWSAASIVIFFVLGIVLSVLGAFGDLSSY